MGMRYLQFEVLSRLETEPVIDGEDEFLNRRRQPAAVSEAEAQRAADAQDEGHQIADQQCPFLTERQVANRNGPACGQPHDAGHHELLPAPRSRGERLGQHEGGEEDERGGAQHLPGGVPQAQLKAGLLVLNADPDGGHYERDQQEQRDHGELLGSPGDDDPQHENRNKQDRRTHPPRRTSDTRVQR